MKHKIEYVRFIKPVPFLGIQTNDTIRIYYDHNCTRWIKVDDLMINVDKKKDIGYLELIDKYEK
ncbi:MAG: hypothetical protein ABIJ34_03950 [archaeon]